MRPIEIPALTLIQLAALEELYRLTLSLQNGYFYKRARQDSNLRPAD